MSAQSTPGPIPALPAEISPDGREIWDWASRLSDAVHRADEAKRLAQQIRNAETQCGGCEFWMTRSCPRERHDNIKGRSSGPSSQALKCSQFVMTRATAAGLEAARAQLAKAASPSGQREAG